MTRQHIATVPPGVYFRPRHNGCVGSGSTPLNQSQERRGTCPECLGDFGMRHDGKLRYHRRKDPR